MRHLMYVTFLCGISACSQQPYGSGAHWQFKTLITSDNIKRFELSVPPKVIDPLSQKHYEETSPSQRYFKSQLEDTLAQNGFCREGYLPLGRFAGESSYRLRGECKEAASAEDKAKFPNSIERW
jgi:hypothetical protein